MLDILFFVFFFWFLYYLLNHSVLLRRPRAVLGTLMPGWLIYLLKCPLCLSFWGLILVQILHFALWSVSALSLFVGYLPLTVICPPLTLFTELIYQKLSKNGRS